MNALRIAAAAGLIATLACPVAANAAPTAARSEFAVQETMPKISPHAMAVAQKAAAALAGVTSGRADLTIAGSALATHVTFTKTPPAAEIQTTIGATPFTDTIAIDGLLFQRLGNGTYGATRFTSVAKLLRALIITQLAMMPKHVSAYNPTPIKPPTVTERDATEDGIAVGQLLMAAYLPAATLRPTAQKKAPIPVRLQCSFAQSTGLPHRCAMGFAGKTYLTIAFSGWNDPANIVAAPLGVPTPPPDAQPMITPMPTMLPSTIHASGSGA